MWHDVCVLHTAPGSQPDCARSRPWVSVIIPCHNCARALPLQLDSLVVQEGASPFEVVIVDNRSTDGTAQVALRWADRLDLRVVPAPERGNVAYARNVGAAAAFSENLIFLDGDDAVPPHYLRYCRRALTEGHEFFATGFVDVDSEEFSRDLARVLSGLDRRENGELKAYEPPSAAGQNSDWPIVPGCGFGVTRSFFMALGGFDEVACPGAEDNDLAIRAHDRGVLAPILGCATVAYRSSSVGRTAVGPVYRRALSVARVEVMTGRSRPGSSRCRTASVIRSILAGYALLLRPTPATWRSWRTRVVIDVALAVGHLWYGRLGRVPARRLGSGLNEASNRL